MTSVINSTKIASGPSVFRWVLLNKSQPPAGLSLLLSMFVLSAILIVALSAGNLIFRELKVTGASDRGVQAFYAAESGLEDALYDFRQLNQSSLAIDEGLAQPIGRGQWWRDSAETITNLDLTLLENEVTEVMLFEPDASGNQAQSIRFSWSNLPAVCPGADFTWIEVVQSYWNVTEPKSERALFSPSAATGSTVNINGNYPYVRLRALFGDACNLTLRAYEGNDGTGAVFELPAQLRVTATGEVGDTRQALSVTVPARAPQAGAFDYTLFSEQSICKNVSTCD